MLFTFCALYPDTRDASYAAHPHAPHASWYGNDALHEHDSRRATSPQHPHEHGAPGSPPSRPVTGRPAEDGAAESSHGVTAGGASQAAGGADCTQTEPTLSLLFFLHLHTNTN